MAGDPRAGSYVKDPDGTLLQFNESGEINPATSILQYPKTASVEGLQPVFRPKRLDGVTVSVTKLDRCAELYRKLCGPEMRRSNSELVFRLGAGTLVVRESQSSKHHGIDHFGVLVERYDQRSVASRMKALGAELQIDAENSLTHFTDPDGIRVNIAEMPAD